MVIVFLQLACLKLCLGQQVRVGEEMPVGFWEATVTDVASPSEAFVLKDTREGLLIIDFWTSYCAPCIVSLNKLNSLMAELPPQVQVISVSAESEKKVRPIADRNQWNFPVVVNDTLFGRYFPHTAVPHLVWIYNGKFLGATHGEDISLTSILDVMERGSITHMAVKKDDLGYDGSRSLVFDDNGGTYSDLKAFSLLTGYLEGVYDGGGIRRRLEDGTVNLKVVNANLSRLYRYVASRGDNRLLHENRLVITDPEIHALSPDTGYFGNPALQKHIYSYETTLPIMEGRALSRSVLLDLNRYFGAIYGIEGSLTNENRECIIFDGIDDHAARQIKSKGERPSVVIEGGNVQFSGQSIEAVIEFLGKYYSTYEFPLVNEIPGDFLVDITIPIAINEHMPHETEGRDAAITIDFLENSGFSVRRDIRNIAVLKIERLSDVLP